MGKRNKERHNREANKKQPPQKCVADYCLPLEYNALELPSSERQDVQINLEVLDVLRVDDKKFSLSLSLYFGVVWKEHRLHLPPPGSNNSGASWLPIDLEFMSNLWVRIFIFSNFYYCMLPNPNDSFSN